MPGSNNKSAWIVGGTTLIGTGVGLMYLQTSVLFFAASLLISASLAIASILPDFGSRQSNDEGTS